jgi:acetyl-CoA carboxylase beta subunit
MSDKKNTAPIIPAMKSDSTLKEYRCPHCDRFLFKGNIKKLNMVCHHCHKMINAEESELVKKDSDVT